MKRLLTLALIIGVLTLTALVVFLRRPLPAPSIPTPPTANASPAFVPPQKAASTAAPRINNPVSTPAKIAPVVVESGIATAAFDDFALWAEQSGKSSASVVEGERLAWKRREAMLDLIQTDPARASHWPRRLPGGRSLPPQVTKFFEEQLDGRGDFTVAVGTDFAQGSTTVFRNVKLGGKNYQAFVYGRRLTQPCKSGIPLHGIALEGKMAVDADPLRRLTPDEAVALAQKRGQPLDPFCSVSGQPAASLNQPVFAESGGGVLCFCGTDYYDLVNKQWSLAESGGETPIGTPTATGDNWTHGAKTVLYMRVNFPDDLTEPVSEANAYSTMDSVNTFYTEGSYNLTSLQPTVAPLVTLPQTKAWYATIGPEQLQADARAATKQAGFDTANYDLDITCFNSVPGPDYSYWSGLAYVGGKGLWLQGDLGGLSAGVAAHELGHNYGLWHANFWNTTANASMIGPGTNLEYGNIFDTMGAAYAGIYQFNAAHKNVLDWLKADAVQLVTSNGVYRIYPFDAPARVDGRFYAAVVRKDFMRNYWLEFRQLFTGNPWTQSGVLLDWSPWPQSNGGTQLIDTTPGSPTFSGDTRDDAAVVVGRTFNDNAAGVHITTLARGATGTDPWLDVQVNLGAFPGNQPPVLAMEVDQTNVVPGALGAFSRDRLRSRRRHARLLVDV